jgi:hypothetical protein
VCVVAPGRGVADGERVLRRRFAVELGRLMYRTHWHQFPTERWRAANPPGFTYTGEAPGDAGVSFGAMVGPARGLTVSYGASDPETDAAMFIAALLTGDPNLAAARRVSASVDAKAELARFFLERVHPGFDEAWFGSMRSRP